MITINGSNSNQNVSSIRASQVAESAHVFKRSVKNSRGKIRHCSICRQAFAPEYRYQLFCGRCRTKDDSFIFNEWLPRIPEPYSMVVGQ